jgi:hypothetical protein
MRLRATTGPVGAGARDHWVTIQTRPDDSTADSGFPTDAPWTDLASVAMAREDVDADEIERGAQLMAVTTTRWEMPYMAAMDPERVDVMKLRRLVYLGRSFDILGAIPIGRETAIALLTDAYGKTPTEATS